MCGGIGFLSNNYLIVDVVSFKFSWSPAKRVWPCFVHGNNLPESLVETKTKRKARGVNDLWRDHSCKRTIKLTADRYWNTLYDRQQLTCLVLISRPPRSYRLGRPPVPVPLGVVVV